MATLIGDFQSAWEANRKNFSMILLVWPNYIFPGKQSQIQAANAITSSNHFIFQIFGQLVFRQFFIAITINCSEHILGGEPWIIDRHFENLVMRAINTEDIIEFARSCQKRTYLGHHTKGKLGDSVNKYVLVTKHLQAFIICKSSDRQKFCLRSFRHRFSLVCWPPF